MVVGEIARPVEVLVIGGGPGGYTAAARAAELGKEVVLVEADRLGGVCLNIGCIPSKALITVANEWNRLQTSASRGIMIGDDAGLDFRATQAWKNEVVDELVAGVAGLLANVEVVTGNARLLDGRRVSVETGDQVAHFQFEHCILATGSRPARLPDLPCDGVQILDSTSALALTHIPEDLVVVGGGYIGLELGTAYAKMGSTVTIVETLDRIGAGFDPDLMAPVEARLDELGVQVFTNALVQGRDPDGAAIVEGPGGAKLVQASHILVSVGRVPNTDELQLERAGITLRTDGRIPVDSQMRTSSRRFFAIGDVVEGPALAHKASEQGRVAAEVIAGLPSGFDQHVPAVAFTDPEVAQVGLTEAQARDAGYDVAVGRSRFRANGRARTINQTDGLVKLVADKQSQMILGVGISGPDASDLISEGVLAVEMAARVDDLVRTIHPHPTLSESLVEAAYALLRRMN